MEPTVTTGIEPSNMPGASCVSDQSDQAAGAEDIAISCHENDVPAFVETELERLYENLYSSLLKFRLDGLDEHASTYVVRKNGRIVTLFLFRRERGEVTVLNELIEVGDADVRRFAGRIFGQFDDVTVISFRTVRAKIGRLRFPYQRFNCSEDIVLTLPETAERYHASLGKNMRWK